MDPHMQNFSISQTTITTTRWPCKPTTHSLEIRGLFSMKLPKHIASKFAIFWIMFCNVDRTSTDTNSKLLVKKNDKNHLAFLIPKVCQILKDFAKQFHHLWTYYFWRVNIYVFCCVYPISTLVLILECIHSIRRNISAYSTWWSKEN